MISNPLVSIAIPFYNDSKYLGNAISSVLNQSFTDWELLLVDDGSTDGTLQIAKKYTSEKVRIISDGENKGLASRLNETTQIARGVFYFRMDADDIMFPDRIQKQISILEEHPEIDVVGTSAIIIGGDNEVLYGMKGPMTAPKKRSDVINGNIFIHPSVAGRTAWFREHPYDDSKRRSQDFFLWLNSVDHSRFAVIDEPLLFYRVINNDIWGKFKRDNRTMYNYFKSQLSFHNIIEPLKQCVRQQVRLPLFYCYYHLKGSEGIIRRRYRMLDNDEKYHYAEILKEVTDIHNSL